MNIILQFILILWQLPQAICGMFCYLICKRITERVKDKKILVSTSTFPGNFSLYPFVFLTKNHTSLKDDDEIIQHELGHCIQSLYLGPLYLIVIAIPSVIWCLLYGSLIRKTPNGYYKFYTESWANKLVGLNL